MRLSLKRLVLAGVAVLMIAGGTIGGELLAQGAGGQATGKSASGQSAKQATGKTKASQKKAGKKKPTQKKGGKKRRAKKKASRKPLNPRYRPEGGIISKSPRFYVWYSGGNWNLRTASRKTVRFRGTIQVIDGKLKSTRPLGFEKSRKRRKTNDRWRVNKDKTKLDFELFTAGKSDGLTFKVLGNKAKVKFDLSIGGKKLPKRIFVGKGKQHPRAVPFTLPAAPPSLKKKPTTTGKATAKKAKAK